jgi:hypothetical protein
MIMRRTTTGHAPADPSRVPFARLEDLPNVGPAVAADPRRVGITRPHDLVGRAPYRMYADLCRVTGRRHDPRMLDTFIAATGFMAGEPATPWWKYTADRKRVLASLPVPHGRG